MGDDCGPVSSDDSVSYGHPSLRKKHHFSSQRAHLSEVRQDKRTQKNARERQRVAQVRSQYNVLRSALGDDFRTQKVNKVKTLIGAIDYIRGLRKDRERLLNAKDLSPVTHNCFKDQRFSPPPLGCDETFDAAGEEEIRDVGELEFEPIVKEDDDSPCGPQLNQGPSPFPPPMPQESLIITPAEILLRTPLGSPTLTTFGSFSPARSRYVSPPPIPELTDLFQPSDMIYEVGHNPWPLSPPHSLNLYHYPAMPYYS